MKICTNCANGNINSAQTCAKCGASLNDAIPVKANHLIQAGKIMNEVRANKEVFGKFKKTEPAKPASLSIELSSTGSEPQKATPPVAASPPQYVPYAYTPKAPYCPKCGSTSLSASKKGFGVGKAVVGAAIVGPFGLIAGNVGAKKVRITCLNCGHSWIAGR